MSDFYEKGKLLRLHRLWFTIGVIVAFIAGVLRETGVYAYLKALIASFLTG